MSPRRLPDQSKKRRQGIPIYRSCFQLYLKISYLSRASKREKDINNAKVEVKEKQFSYERKNPVC